MQIFLICLTIIGFVVSLIICFSVFEDRDLEQGQIEDVKLRSKSVRVYLLLVLALILFVITLYLFVGWDKVKNYDHAFVLKEKNNWTLVSETTDEEKVLYQYSYGGNDVDIEVSLLSETDAEKLTNDIREKRKLRVEECEKVLPQLKQAAKEEIKQLKADSKENIKQLKKLYKGNSEQRDALIDENKEQLEISITAVEEKLDTDTALAKAQLKNAKNKRWFETEVGGMEFISIKNNRLYTVMIHDNEREILKDINVSPFGFIAGIIDGCGYCVFQGINLFYAELVPFKTTNNGVTYVAGFILGVLLQIVYLVLLCVLIVSEYKCIKWQKKIASMNPDELYEYRQGLWKNKMDSVMTAAKYSLEYAQNRVSDAEKKVKEYRNLYQDQKPEDLLVAYNEAVTSSHNESKGFFSKLDSFFSAGESDLRAEENLYEMLTGINNFYQARYAVLEKKADLLTTIYNSLREKAVLYLVQMKELQSHLTVKQRDEINRTEYVQTIPIDASLGEINGILSSITNFNREYQVASSVAWNETKAFADSFFDASFDLVSAGLEKKSNNKELGNDELLAAGISASLGLATLAVGKINDHFNKQSANSQMKMQLQEAQSKILAEVIPTINANTVKLKAYINKLQEVNKSIEVLLNAYIQLYAQVVSSLFPKGDSSKTRTVRTENAQKGKTFYSDAELQVIGQLKPFAKTLSAVIDSKI